MDACISNDTLVVADVNVGSNLNHPQHCLAPVIPGGAMPFWNPRPGLQHGRKVCMSPPFMPVL